MDVKTPHTVASDEPDLTAATRTDAQRPTPQDDTKRNGAAAPAETQQKKRRQPAARKSLPRLSSPRTFKPRRAPTPRDSGSLTLRGRFRDRTVFLTLLAALAVGFVAGVQIAHRRQMAREIVASVNGSIIRGPELMNRLELPPIQTASGTSEPAGAAILTDMISLRLRTQFAQKMHAMPNETDLDRRFAEMRNAPDFLQKLAASGQTPLQAKERLRLEMAQEYLLTRDIRVSDAALRRYYRQNTDPNNPRARYYHTETASVFAVVCPTEEQAVLALADMNRGILPATVVAKYSILDPKRTPNGVLKNIHRGRGELAEIPGLENIIFGLKINDQSPPVRLNTLINGKMQPVWWIVRSQNRTPAFTDPYARVKEECRQTIALQQGVEARRTTLEKQFADFRRKSNVQAFWPNYISVVKTMKQ